MNKLIFPLIAMVQVLFFFSCKRETPFESVPEVQITPEFLPPNEVDLKDLGFWTTEGGNWSVASEVKSDFQEEWNLEIVPGSGILVNQVKDEGKRDIKGAADGKHIFSQIQHGDLEMDLEVMVPKGSNSGIYFQGRYEIQIRDTEEDSDLSVDDMGAIYGQKAPAINAARMPGLWQQLKVIFRAPRFNEAGEKISNAKFEKVLLNGFLIHENVEVSSPTTEAVSLEEVSMAPLMIQGDHGPVAFRNIRYKAFDIDQKVELKNITYKLYEGKFDYIPDFSTLPLLKSGEAINFDKIPDLAGFNDGINIEFEGTLSIPIDGDYLFETIIDDGGNLYIDSNLVVNNEGDPGYGVERKIITLSAGEHSFKQTYYQEVWGSTLKVYVEGPGLEKRQIPMNSEQSPREIAREELSLEIEVGEQPELIRGFVHHFENKKTHILNVGTSAGIHYSFDTRNSQLINAWKGRFADVSKMWINRGEEQLLQPLGAVLAIDFNGMALEPMGYNLNENGFPVFEYVTGKSKIKDLIVPSTDIKGLKRTIEAEGAGINFVLANAKQIQLLTNGWYSIDQRYLIKPESEVKIEGGKLTAQVKPGSTFIYSLIW
ncbi:MAG: hypothetical protein RJA52_1363 [Bacteroidota bacterium]